MYRSVNCEILQGTASSISLKDSGVLHSVWTQLTVCKCATDQYYCYLIQSHLEILKFRPNHPLYARDLKSGRETHNAIWQSAS
jgi:hypothetical protein